MFKRFSVVFILTLAGLAGSALLVFTGRDSMSIIIIGFGFGLLQLHILARDGHVDPKDYLFAQIFPVLASAAGIASALYNTVRFTTGYNKVLIVVFIILMAYNTIMIFSIIHSKKKI
jgi:hypothetical protein